MNYALPIEPVPEQRKHDDPPDPLQPEHLALPLPKQLPQVRPSEYEPPPPHPEQTFPPCPLQPAHESLPDPPQFEHDSRDT